MTVLITVINLINFNCLDQICQSLDFKSGALEKLVGKIWGSCGKILVTILIWASQISVFIGAFLLTTEMINDLICSNPQNPVCVERKNIIILVGIFNLFVAAIPSLKMFSYISMLSIVVMFFSLGLIFYRSCQDLAKESDLQLVLGKRTFLFDLGALPQTLGIMLYAFEGITMYIPMRKDYNSRTSFHPFFIGTLLFISSFILFINVPSYYRFYDKTEEIIFMNFGPQYLLVHVMKIVYLGVVFLSNPINLFPIYNSFLSFSSVKKFLHPKSKTFREMTMFFIRIVLTLICLLVAALVPSFINFISFVGSFFFSLLGIVIPTLLYLTHFSRIKKLTLFDAIWKSFLVVISLTIFVSTSVFSFKALVFNK